MTTNKNSFKKAIQSIKEIILIRFREVSAISNLYDYEDEIITKSVFKTAKDNSGTEQQFLDLLTISYIIQGICSNHENEIYERGISSEE